MRVGGLLPKPSYLSKFYVLVGGTDFRPCPAPANARTGTNYDGSLGTAPRLPDFEIVLNQVSSTTNANLLTALN